MAHGNEYEKIINQTNDSLLGQTILLAYRGSIAHNLYMPSAQEGIDDIDLIGVVVPDKESYIGLDQFGSRGTLEIKVDEWDMVFYEARKMSTMLAHANPNVLSMLWLNPEHYLKITAAGRLLISQRNLFLSKQIFHTFRGYAYNQLQSMNKNEYSGYMGERRKAIVDEFGFDTKSASHLVRLLIMGNAALRSGELTVWQTGRDRELLLAIKQGKYSIDQVKGIAEGLFESLLDGHVKSQLPEESNFDLISKLCVRVVETAWRNRSHDHAYQV